MTTTNNKPGYFSLKSLNPVVRVLTLSDFLIICGWGLITPIFAIYIIDSIKDASIETVGIAMTVFLLAKSLTEVPAGIIVDKIRGERGDFVFMFIGSILFSLIPLIYLFIDSSIELYFVQFFYGMAAAITFPTWSSIFARHIDKNRAGIEYGVYHTLIDIGSASTAAIGGFIAFRFSFSHLFILVSITSLLGTMFLLFVYKEMKKK